MFTITDQNIEKSDSQEKAKETETNTKPKPESSTLEKEIARKIGRIDRTRRNRIGLSERLKKYNHRWKFAFAILNFEAIFLIVMSLQGISNGTYFSMFSAFFSIYVILLQYFVNELNYNERSLKSHYHQLELEDVKFKLENLILEITESKNDNKVEQLKIYQDILDDYQLLLKNNENHSNIDDVQMSRGDMVVESEQQKKGKQTIIIRKNSSFNFLQKRDFTIDNIFLQVNLLLGVLIVLFLLLFFIGQIL